MDLLYITTSFFLLAAQSNVANPKSDHGSLFGFAYIYMKQIEVTLKCLEIAVYFAFNLDLE